MSPRSSEELSGSQTSLSDYESKRLLDEFATSKRRSQVSWKNMCLTWQSCCLVLSAIFLAGNVIVWRHMADISRNVSCQSGDAPSWADDFEPDLRFDSRVTFQPYFYFGGPPSNKTDEMWRRLSPPGDGIVAIPKELATRLPKSIQAPNDENALIYGVSVFHQLHCLNFLRFAYYPETIKDMPEKEVGLHRDHCLDYIRQALMCHADATFEPLTMVGINGMGATHQCRDFDKVFSWAYERRSDKSHGSGYHGIVTHTPGHRNEFEEDESH